MEQISLIELQKKIKNSIETFHDSAYWVTAEINEIKTNSAGHCYLELVQKSEKNDFIEAKITAIIWANMFRLLKSYFETSTGTSLDSGIKILIKSYVQYHELYGLSLNIIDIDPTYTIGNVELQKQKTIQQLQDDGIFDMNQELEFPEFPQRIAIISSKQAAGYEDFIEHLYNNEYGYKFYTKLFTAMLQGKSTEKTIITALDTIHNEINSFDLVVIIRGGGSQTDLSTFNSYRLASHIAQFPLPILTGIGHNKDTSICDMVAHQMLKTPTAVADFLIDTILSQESTLINLIDKLNNIIQTLVYNESNQLKLYLSKIQNITKSHLSKEKILLNNWLPKQIRSTTQFLIKEHLQKLSENNIKIELNNPLEILKKGYSITLLNGKKINSTTTIKQNDIVDTILAEGKFTSQIISKDEQNEEKRKKL